MKLNIINLANGTINIHAADCKDCAKDQQQAKRGGIISYIGDFNSRLEVSVDFWGDMINEGSMTAEDGLGELTFKPCCKALPVRIA